MELLALDASAFSHSRRPSSYSSRTNARKFLVNSRSIHESGRLGPQRKLTFIRYEERHLNSFCIRKSCKCFSQAKDAAASSVDELGPGTLEEHEIRDALTDFSSVWSSADVDFLTSLPKGSQVEVGDAAFALSNGAVTEECGEDAGEALKSMAASLERGDVSGLASAVSQLTTAALRLTPGSEARAGISRRLKKAGRLLGGMQELKTVGESCVQAGEAIGSGCAQQVETVSTPQPRVLKFGSMQVEITRGGTFIGAGVSAAFSALSWYFATNLSSTENPSSRYSNNAAVEVSQSLKGALTIFGFSSFGLAALSTFGLIALGIRLTSSDETKS